MSDDELQKIVHKGIASCDERISSITDSLLSVRAQRSIWLSLSLDPNDKEDNIYATRESNLEHGIKCIELEREIYKAIGKKNIQLLPLLLEKFNEYCQNNIETTEALVKSGYLQEQDYIEFCEIARNQHDYLKKLTDKCGNIMYWRINQPFFKSFNFN